MALVLKYADIDHIGEREISRKQANELSRKFLARSIVLLDSAVKLDPEVAVRSPFVAAARRSQYARDGLADISDRNNAEARFLRHMHWSAWMGFYASIETDGSTANGGWSVGAAGLYRLAKNGGNNTLDLHVGLAVGQASNYYGSSYDFATIEVGARGVVAGWLELGAAWTPSLVNRTTYVGRFDTDYYEETYPLATRWWAGVTVMHVQLLAGVRIFSSSRIWLEPIAVGVTF